MATNKSLPLPPRMQDDRSELSDLQMMFLDCHILHLGSSKLLFKLLLGVGKSDVASNSLMTALLNSADGKQYIKNRTEQLEKHYFPSGGSSKSGKKAEDTESINNEMETFQQKLFRKISADLEQDLEEGTIDYKSSAIIEKFMQKALDFKAEDQNAPDPPRIYLPENCDNCRYRLFCESSEVVDDCKLCKYKKSCNERGEVYDYKDQLEVKQ